MKQENNIESKIDNIEKMNKKLLLSLEFLRDNIELNNINEKKSLETEEINLKIIKTLIYILDEIDNINKFAIDTCNQELVNNINGVQQNIKKNLIEINVEEIPTANEVFDNKIHKCVQVIEGSNEDKFKIVNVIKKGYKYNGDVIRPAEVIATK